MPKPYSESSAAQAHLRSLLIEVMRERGESLAEFGATLAGTIDAGRQPFSRQYVYRLKVGQDPITVEIAQALHALAVMPDGAGAPPPAGNARENMADNLLAPFPWFGGKSRVAPAIWEHFGDVDNYVEPFAGSLAVLLGRPADHARTIETVNDMDNYLVNFWRALQADPDAVARWADWPAIETDLTARHLWLVNEGRDRLATLEADPDAYDAQIAGWWVWGINLWIGRAWCAGDGPWYKGDDGRLVNDGASRGIEKRRMRLGYGHGTRASRADDLVAYMHALASRLRRVIVSCGDWTRVVTPGALAHGATVGILLDPPYDAGTGRDMGIYTHDTDVSPAVREWAIANGDNPRYRIALCGYEGEHDMPDTWDKVQWVGSGSYKTSRGDQNGRRFLERIWFSPYCRRLPLFRSMPDAEVDAGGNAPPA